ncbi:MAG: ABC transporter permease [Clostridia bacterium]|nr:ABC transporter permease [Clostridia bacterium]MBP5270545.1 ABC transporter permease [Clostridia bacterium]
MSDRKRQRRGFHPFYFMGEALVGMKRHGVMTVASVLVLTSCLSLLGVFGVLVSNLNENITRLGLLNEIVVFCDSSLDRTRVDEICSDIKSLDNVSYVEYISKEQGLEALRETYSDYGDLFDEIEKNGDNPLSDSFVVTYSDGDAVNALEFSLRSIPGVTKVNNRLDYATKVASFKRGMSAVFVWFFVLLFAVSIFVIFNTIKLAVHGRRNEIDVMRYMGATRGFIVTPFVIEGILIGVISGFAAAGLVIWVSSYASGRLSADLSMIEILPVSRFVPALLTAFPVIGALSGVLAGLLSIRKNLKN